MQEILALYYSHHGSAHAIAQQIARGIESLPGVAARMRTVPKVANHVAGNDSSMRLSDEEKRLVFAQGRRLTETALKLLPS